MMRKIKTSVLIGLFLLVTISTKALAEPSSVLLEKGIYTEQTVGDIDQAIDIYQQIITNAQVDRSAIAEAHYRLGKCYLKKAVENFCKLTDNYPEQKVWVDKAKPFINLTQTSQPSGEPIVIETNPIAMSNNVSPELSKITVTFNQPMMDRSWSWTGGGEFYPTTTGRPYYDTAKTTCTLPVKLEPGHVYWVGINSPSYKNFKTMKRQPAKRYVILFATADKNGKPTVIPADMLQRAKAINDACKPVQVESEETKKVVKKADKSEVANQADRLASEKLSTRGWALWRQRKLDEAEKLFEQAVVKNPQNSNALNGLGWSQLNQGMSENAKVAFEKCIAIEPKHAAALNGLGYIAKGQGNVEEAIKNWKLAIEAAAGATASLSGITQAYMELKQYDDAIKYYRKWLKVAPQDQQAIDGLKKAEALKKTVPETQKSE